ncbi:glutathione synthetase ATP-binding domain-like protein [Dothidotthia symphoricarpi CBS 119687]|uniref:Glutathione synthetase ATP-binding domain-like protein n=1 Tax=Dothidotthia symphoricarpi CBS 119687 TaxID=1392245 RepID=A0A6A6A2Y7_9PLEO|nr:glutathione synthetase ATP-binding domain-like protein [Dothidotthia symphoricarpi CBS 119687]KAF2126170.1 glutathione synthetase ATP-binding domain-like protein [Dothidotthia symphoricarpi CBS 119687]
MDSALETAMLDVFYAPADGKESRLYSFAWRTNASPEAFVIQSVDLVIERLTHDAQAHQHVPTFTWPQILRSGLELGYGKSDIRTFLDQALQEHDSTAAPMAIKLIMPKVGGYVAQSNIIQTRLHGCAHVESVAGFLRPGERIEAFTASKTPRSGKAALISELYDQLTTAIGAVSAIKNTTPGLESPWQVLDSIEQEFQNRLGLQFLVPEPVLRKRIGLVQCLDYRMSLELLLHLNIDLVVFDEPGTCMEDSNGPLAHLRESFHPIDLNPDDGFVQRLYLATRDQRLDGLTSRFDAIFEKVAQVAELLKLPTPAPSAMAIATDKYLTRITCSEPNLDHNQDGPRGQAICVKSRQELEKRLMDSEKPLQIPYPVVVKPTNGWGSYGVAKAVNETELLDHVEWAAGYIIGFVNSEVMIEPYCDGPEVDINLAMWDGEVTFFDVCDNAPTAGDLDEVTGSGRKDFQEGLFMYPSQLPASEQTMVCQYIHKCILRMGFRTGVFHCEARVRDSSMHYVRQSGSGIIDLEAKSTTSDSEPSVFLLEINARAPGYVGLYASGWNYGVDLWALHMLHCAGDEARFRALSVSFSNGAQHDSAVLLIMPEKKGILRSEDPRPRLRQEKPELAACVPLCLNYFKVGQEVTPPDDTENCFTSVMVVESKKGRADLMKTVEEVRFEWTPVIE